MSDDLRSDLQTVDGVGEKTAEKLITVLEDGGYLGESKTNPYVEKAKEAAERGDDREAAVFLRRASDE